MCGWRDSNGGRAGVRLRRAAGRELQPSLRSVNALAALVFVGLALAAAGCAGGDDDDASDEGAAPAPAQSRVPPELVDEIAVTGGSPAARTALRRVVDGMEDTTLER